MPGPKHDIAQVFSQGGLAILYRQRPEGGLPGQQHQPQRDLLAKGGADIDLEVGLAPQLQMQPSDPVHADDEGLRLPHWDPRACGHGLQGIVADTRDDECAARDGEDQHVGEALQAICVYRGLQPNEEAGLRLLLKQPDRCAGHEGPAASTLPDQDHAAQRGEDLHLLADGCPVLAAIHLRSLAHRLGLRHSPREDVVQPAPVLLEQVVQARIVEGAAEEQGGLPATRLRPRGVVVARHHVELLLALVGLVQLLRMVRQDEVIARGGDEQGGRERTADVVEGLELLDVEVGLGLDDAPDKRQDGAHHPSRDLRVAAGQLLCEQTQRGEGAV
mmetsp:Transcript_70412/g.177501  ORF Transcript_70412/g.177501 Transcript_70412/m.177501 type:complete len:331 (-) Transcript_70412:184-1176(-)